MKWGLMEISVWVLGKYYWYERALGGGNDADITSSIFV